MSETGLLKRIQLAATSAGNRLFRNQVGRYEVNGRWLHTGLCVGSSDLIGWTTVEIRPEDVGRRIAVFTAVEGKVRGNRTSEEQDAFIRAVQQAGGLALVAYAVDDYAQGVAKIVTRE